MACRISAINQRLYSEIVFLFFLRGVAANHFDKKPPLGGTKEKGLLRQAKILIQTKRNSSGVLQ